MHFSNMAVSLLAQSLPLAVAYGAGWRKREKSESQRRTILQAAFYEEFRDNKGFVPEKKHAEATRLVQDKQGTVIEKKRSGTVRPEQGVASSEIASVDREPAIKCDPLSKAPDAGIFACGMDSHCVKSKESKLGGFCVAFEQAPILSRALQLINFTCDEGPDADGLTCNCSLFNNTSDLGSYTCSLPEGACPYNDYPSVCGNVLSTLTVLANNSAFYNVCFEPEGGTPVESFCSSYSYDLTYFSAVECELKINNITCNSCSIVGCDLLFGSIFDCTNTVANIEGNTCERGLLGAFLVI